MGKRVRVIINLEEQFRDLEVELRVGRQPGLHGDQFGLDLRPRLLFQQKFDQFEARGTPVLVGVAVPDSVNCVVIVAQRPVRRLAVSGQARKLHIHHPVLRLMLPQVDEVRLGFVESAFRLQRLGQAELIKRIVPIKSEGRTKVLYGCGSTPRLQVVFATSVHPFGQRSLPAVKARREA